MSKWDKQAGLYAITPCGWTTERLLTATEEILEAGIAFLQYRNKQANAALQHEQAKALLNVCQAYKVPFIVNDDPALAQAMGADGVHLGRDDQGWQSARKLLGDKAIIGVSCYGNQTLADQAAHAGMDYVAFGSVFASVTKPQAETLGLERLAGLCRASALPVVAIGGIASNNVSAIYKAGASYAAVISALFEAPSLAMAVKTLSSSDHQ